MPWKYFGLQPPCHPRMPSGELASSFWNPAKIGERPGQRVLAAFVVRDANGFGEHRFQLTRRGVEEEPVERLPVSAARHNTLLRVIQLTP